MSIRKTFLTGFLVLLPLFITVYVFIFVLSTLDGIFGYLIEIILGRSIPGLGLLLTLSFIFLTGIIASNFIGQKLIIAVEKLILTLPFLKTVYKPAKQLIEAFTRQSKNAFKKAVLVEYPRDGMYAIGFITGGILKEAHYKTGKSLINVFIPTTPNPTSGYYLVIDENKLIMLDMTVEEAIKVVVSSGVVSPSYNRDSP